MDHDDYVVSFARHPAMEGEDSVLVAHVNRAESFAAKTGKPPAKPPLNSPRETYVIEPLFVALIDSRPVQQQVLVKLEIVGPLFVLQKLLSHKQHRNARRRQANASGHASPAAAKPGARVTRIAQPGYTLFAVPVNDVVVLRPLDKLPMLVETFRPQAPRQAGHIERAVIRERSHADDVANRNAQSVG